MIPVARGRSARGVPSARTSRYGGTALRCNHIIDGDWLLFTGLPASWGGDPDPDPDSESWTRVMRLMPAWLVLLLMRSRRRGGRGVRVGNDGVSSRSRSGRCPGWRTTASRRGGPGPGLPGPAPSGVGRRSWVDQRRGTSEQRSEGPADVQLGPGSGPTARPASSPGTAGKRPPRWPDGGHRTSAGPRGARPPASQPKAPAAAESTAAAGAHPARETRPVRRKPSSDASVRRSRSWSSSSGT